MATYECAKCSQKFLNPKQSRLFDRVRDPVTDVFPCFECQKKQKEYEKRILKKLSETKNEETKWKNAALNLKRSKGLSQQLDEAKQEIKLLRGDLRSAEKDKSRLLGDLLSAENDKSRLRGDLRSAEKDKSRLRGDLRSAEKDKSRLRDRIQLELEKQKSKDKEIARLQKEILLEQTKQRSKDQSIEEMELKLELERLAAAKKLDKAHEETKKAREETKEARKEKREAQAIMRQYMDCIEQKISAAIDLREISRAGNGQSRSSLLCKINGSWGGGKSLKNPHCI